jgi:hypothetical protein
MLIEVRTCQLKPFPKSWAGVFEAWLDGRLLCVSRVPFCSAARVLLAEGVAPETVLQMRHAGSGTVALEAKLGVAAGLTVAEEPRVHFAAWKVFQGFV